MNQPLQFGLSATPPTGRPLALRPYQAEAVDAVFADFAEHQRVLGVAATGLGKTVIFAHAAARLGGRALVLAHRDELVQQAAEKITMIWPDASVGIVKAARNDYGADVVVASVQTLARASRRAQVPEDAFDLIVVDEAHHATADTYQAVLGYFGAWRDGGPKVLGVTATPGRGDKVGLTHAGFEKISFDYPIVWGIRHGYLADLRAVAVGLDLDLAHVKRSHGDLTDASLGEALADADAPAEIVTAWHRLAPGRKTLVFTPLVETARQVAAAFASSGVSAAFLSGETPERERRAVLADFAAGRIQLIANCAVLTEGFDEPTIDCIVIARPTLNASFYAQMVGRGTRRAPGKTDCLVIDVVGNEPKLITASSLFGLSPEDAARAQAEGMALVELLGVLEDEQTAAREGAEAAKARHEQRVREMNLFAVQSEFAWVPVEGRYVMDLGQRRKLELIEGPEFGQWNAVVIERRQTEGRYWTTRTPVANALPQEWAMGIAEDWVRQAIAAGEVNAALLSREAPWRATKASPKQLDFLAKLGVPIEPGLTKGEASALIDRVMAERSGRRGGRPSRSPRPRR